MNKTYQVAGHTFRVSGDKLCSIIEQIHGFKPFETTGQDVLFTLTEGTKAPAMASVQYEFTFEDVTGIFGKSNNGYILIQKPAREEALYLWSIDGEKDLHIYGNLSLRLCRFALWVGFGLKILPFNTVAIHSSCIVYQNKAVLFLGESGTGKSTHTRLWRENIEGAFLLNDDSPVITVRDNKVWAYGSPWSGKTPCYKTEKYELAGCVRLSQAPFNKIKRLSVLESYGAIHPSCPPEFAYDTTLYDHISSFINKLISSTPFYHLSCLPNKEAALLSSRTIFGNETDSE